MTVIPADHSGPSFNFEGTVSPKFHKAFLEWVDAENKKNDGHINIIDADRDGRICVEFDFGEGSLSVNSTPDGTISVRSSGDSQVTPVPGGPIFTIAKYSDEYGEVVITYDGKNYDIDDLVEILKKRIQQERKKLADSPIGANK